MKRIFKYVGALALAGALALQPNNVFAEKASCDQGQTEHTAYFMFLNSASESTFDSITDTQVLSFYTSADKANVIGNVGTQNILGQWNVPITYGSDATNTCREGSLHCKPWTVEEYWRNYHEMWQSILSSPNGSDKDGKVYHKGNDSYIGHTVWYKYTNAQFTDPQQKGDEDISKTDLLKYLEDNISSIGTSELVTKGTNLPETLIRQTGGIGTIDESLIHDMRVERNFRLKDKKTGFDLNGKNKIYSPAVYAVKYCTGTVTEPDQSTDPVKKILTYDANGGKNAPKPQEFTESCTPINKSEPTRDGYTFLGWTENRDGTGKKYGKNEDPEYCKESATIYAQWKENDPDNKTITYDKNTNDVVKDIPANVDFTDKCIEKISDNWPEREGWRFIAWNTKKDGSGDSFRPGTELSKEYQCKDLTLYAQWEEVKYNDDGSYTITYDANGGKNAPANQNAENGTCTKISDAKPTLSKSKFLGWSRDPKATEPDPKYSAGNEYCGDEGNVTLYAVWSPQTGISAHLIAFGVAAITAGAALIVAKKKDLFKQI